MQLTGTQIRNMSLSRNNSFFLRTTRHIRQYFGAHTVADSERWPAAWKELLKRCRDYGLESESAITTYINAVVAAGPDFEFRQPFQGLPVMLRSPVLDEAEKIRQLIDRVEAHLLVR